jgi:hypothetical protein
MNAVDFAWQFDPLPTTRELTSGEIRQRAIIIGLQTMLADGEITINQSRKVLGVQPIESCLIVKYCSV